MPAVTAEDTLVLPRIPRPDASTSRSRPVAKVVDSHRPPSIRVAAQARHAIEQDEVVTISNCHVVTV